MQWLKEQFFGKTKKRESRNKILKKLGSLRGRKSNMGQQCRLSSRSLRSFPGTPGIKPVNKSQHLCRHFPFFGYTTSLSWLALFTGTSPLANNSPIITKPAFLLEIEEYSSKGARGRREIVFREKKNLGPAACRPRVGVSVLKKPSVIFNKREGKGDSDV